MTYQIRYRIISLLILSVSAFTNGFSQDLSLSKDGVKGCIIDTIEINETDVLVNYLWLSDTIAIRLSDENIEIDSSYFENQSEEYIKKWTDLYLGFRQNCFSYALEQYFLANELENQSLFNERTVVELGSMTRIIDNHFEEILSFKTEPRKNLKIELPDNVLLGFYNQDNLITHAVYYSSGTFYTKNGGFQPSEFKSLKSFLKEHYKRTKTIKIFKFNK